MKWPAIALVAITALATPAFSQEGEVPFTPPPPPGKAGVGGIGGLPVFIPPGVPGTGIGETPADLDTISLAVAERLAAAREFCGRIPTTEYIVDCLAERLDAISREMPRSGELAEARQVIADTSRRLAALARANADPELPRATVRTPQDGVQTSRPLTPVRRETAAEINEQAAEIVEQAEILLLRSSQQSALRQLPYQRIAAAMGSNKILLRSL
jgi:hypothetical protein